MGKIKDTVMYPIVAPAGDDIIIGTDKSDSDITKNFTVQSIADLVAGTSNTYTLTNIGNPSSLQLRLSDGTTNNDVTIVPGTGINLSGGTTTSSTINLDIPVTVAHGGTGLTSYSTGDLLYASGTAAISKLSIGSTGKVLQVSSGGIPEWTTFTPGAGTVTSVGPSNGTFVNSSSASITTSGTLQFDLSATGTPSATTFLRGDNTWATPVAGGQLPIENAGSQITAAASKINFTGAGVTATNSSNDVTVDVPLGKTGTPTGGGSDQDIATWSSVNTITGTGTGDAKLLFSNSSTTCNMVLKKTNTSTPYALPRVQIESYVDATTGQGRVKIKKARGTESAPSAILNGDSLGLFGISGHNGSGFQLSAIIESQAVADFTSTDKKADLLFYPNYSDSVVSKMTLKSDGNLEVQQVYSDNTHNAITFNSSSGATSTFDGNTFKTLSRVTFGSGSPSALTVDFTNVYGTFPYHLIISGGSGKTITFTLNGNAVSFPSGSGGQFTPTGTNDLIQFNFTPTAGGFNGGFATLLGSNYSI
jgi:hypothetical protein